MRARFLAAVAYLALGVHVVSLLHVMAVRHVSCPEHGEVIHGGGDLADAVIVERSGWQGFPEETSGLSDDHCLVVATQRRDGAGLAAEGSPAPVPPPALALVAVESDVPSLFGRSVFWLAPKNSPPTPAA